MTTTVPASMTTPASTAASTGPAAAGTFPAGERGTLWYPASGCDDKCRDGDFRRSGPVTTVVRLTGLVAVLLGGLLLTPLLRGVALRAMARGILAVLGVRTVWRGPEPRPGSLLVANHVSWLDVVAMAAILPVRMVAKHEVRAWAGIGRAAVHAGTIFIDRTRPRALPETVAEVAGALRAGSTIAIFPEGTTYCGPEQGRFRSALFQAAIDAGAPVVPVSIGYDSTEASFVGADTLGASVLRVARVRRLTLTMVAAPALRPDPGADRRVLARAAQASRAGGGYHLAA
ncbi:lysophospholipid acyltransferase family protein [Actinoplanes sp. NEAU-A12]|uniref:Lysophospholipid acyltransferase family protein n=1 Tax=Actinoplanes sandaracinus TaxID=3045177 RepID=A0ABT6WDT4_9ACTN|nr:lysophospholipid acyltransferase family protein [Actinoplanes sandaracinus]MDI6097868.1 lysophospholipid acyltransferase family protein [Actinoplanes sandaracinus]